MSEVKQTLNLKILFMSFLLPIIVIWIIDSTLKGDFSSFDTSDSFTRFANAILTSYTLGSLVLLGNLFFYADSRKRPLAPLFGMVLAVLIGILSTFVLIGMGQNLELWSEKNWQMKEAGKNLKGEKLEIELPEEVRGIPF